MHATHVIPRPPTCPHYCKYWSGTRWPVRPHAMPMFNHMCRGKLCHIVIHPNWITGTKRTGFDCRITMILNASVTTLRHLLLHGTILSAIRLMILVYFPFLFSINFKIREHTIRLLQNCRTYTSLAAEVLHSTISIQSAFHTLSVPNEFTLTVNGTPNLDSLPKVSSGKDTPISEIANFLDEIPVQGTSMSDCACMYQAGVSPCVEWQPSILACTFKYSWPWNLGVYHTIKPHSPSKKSTCASTQYSQVYIADNVTMHCNIYHHVYCVLFMCTLVSCSLACFSGSINIPRSWHSPSTALFPSFSLRSLGTRLIHTFNNWPVMDPIHPVQPMLAKAKPWSESGW